MIDCAYTTRGLSIPTSNGKIRPCCKFSNRLTAPLETIFDVTTFNNIFSSKPFREIQSEHQANIRSRSCRSCWEAEAIGIPSRRQHGIEQYSDTPDYRITDIEFALDFTCNMMCRSCGSDASSRWAQAKTVASEFQKKGIHTEPIHNYRSYADQFRQVFDNTDISGLRNCLLYTSDAADE